MTQSATFERSRTKVRFPERVYRQPDLGDPNEEPSTNAKSED